MHRLIKKGHEMKQFPEFTIPVSGLGDGIHHFNFEVNEDYFKSFDPQVLNSASFKVHLLFDKRPDMYVLDFVHEGEAEFSCDRCLDLVPLSLNGENRLLMKFTEEESENNDDLGDIVYIDVNTINVDVSEYVHEFICLSVPIKKVPEEEDGVCLDCGDEIDEVISFGDDIEEDVETDTKKSVWDALNKIKKNDN